MDVARYRIYNAQFVRSCPSVTNLPTDDMAEVAFIGRSNVGKSTLINAICQRSSLARTSKTPGRTQSFNYFTIDYGKVRESGESVVRGEKSCGYLVDLPGYGYAQVAAKVKRKWPLQIEEYLLKRQQLAGLFLLVDIRRDPGAEEIWIAEYGQREKLVVVMTKADQVTKNEYEKRRRFFLEELKISKPQLTSTALVGKNRRGVDDLRDKVCECLIS